MQSNDSNIWVQSIDEELHYFCTGLGRVSRDRMRPITRGTDAAHENDNLFHVGSFLRSDSFLVVAVRTKFICNRPQPPWHQNCQEGKETCRNANAFFCLIRLVAERWRRKNSTSRARSLHVTSPNAKI